MKKDRVFKLMSVLLPLVFLLLLEVILRLAGYGNDLSLFVQDKEQPYLHLNDKVSLRYFIQENNATTGNKELFLKEKPSGMQRIFVQGESTAVGFPYFHNGAFPRMLEYQLRKDHPEVNLEIINLSMTALNSFAIYDFADEVIEQHPDAVIINAGQNEYYGALGVGSTGTFGSNVAVNRMGIWFRKIKTGQLLSKLLNSFSPEVPTKDYDQTLMKRMVKDQEIPFGSKEFHAGINQYRKNMDETLARYHKAGIRVFLTNPVSNLKDLKPFISLNDSNYNAQKYYDSGKAFHQQGEYIKAKDAFVRAKECDALRFRAPEAIEEILRELAKKYDNVVFVDIRRELENYTDDRTIGNELLLEHVHPNLMGHFLISRGLVKNFRETSFMYASHEMELPFMDYSELPLTPVDSLTGVYSNWLLREGWPFHEPLPAEDTRENTFEEALAGSLSVRTIQWDVAMYRLMEHYIQHKDFAKAVKVGESFILEYPYEYPFYEQIISLCMDSKEYEKAICYGNRAQKLKHNPAVWRQMVILYMKTDQPEKAIPYMDKLISGNSQVDFRPMKELANRIVAIKKAMAEDGGQMKELRLQIYNLYKSMGNMEAADIYKE